jgi:excinuclease ABC subunit A
MHFMGEVEILCDTCNGRRFNDETLEIKYQGLNISEILELSIEDAVGFFGDQPKVMRIIKTLNELGLGYLKLGQRSTTLSGGEAQRVKLASELARPGSAHTMYILDEPTTGLHNADVKVLLKSLDQLVEQGNTVVVTEHHLGMIASADHIIDLGPGSGTAGGKLLASGSPRDIMDEAESLTGMALKNYFQEKSLGGTHENAAKKIKPVISDRSSVTGHPSSVAGHWTSNIEPCKGGTSLRSTSDIEHQISNIKHLTSDISPISAVTGHPSPVLPASISFKGVSTHNLKNIDVDFPLNKITVITGVSGSGKSSLAFDTLHAAGRNRFLDSFSPYVRSQVGMQSGADFEEVSGLTPTLAINRQSFKTNPRSTVGTMTGVYDLYRLLFSRLANSDTDQAPPYSSLFSFNHQQGACKSCDGLGEVTVCDPEKLITNPEKALGDGAMNGHKSGKFYGDPHGQYIHTLFEVGKKFARDYSMPWHVLDADARKLAMYGSGDEIYKVNWKFKRGRSEGEHQFEGVWKGFANIVDEEYRRKHADHRGESMMPIIKKVTCTECGGSRLNADALSFTILGKNIAEVSKMSVAASIEFFKDFENHTSNKKLLGLGQNLRIEILKRLEVLSKLGLAYLSINRSSNTLSGGEAQRVRLAAQLGNGLCDLTFVLDEPTVGLHPSDVANLMQVIRELRDSGNTVVMVEHDIKVIESADHIIEIGPGAGTNGGQIIAVGNPSDVSQNEESTTGKYLFNKKRNNGRQVWQLKEGLQIEKANANNLKDFNLHIPSSGIVAITGVSGSGKSTLVFDVIAKSWARGRAVGCVKIDGLENFTQITQITQQQLSTSKASNLLTFTGIFDQIRTLFSQTEAAKLLGFKKGDFSLNNKGGRCEHCQGHGKIKVSLDFVSDVWVECEVCKGLRFVPEILECRFNEKNISEILEMSVSQAMDFFAFNKNIFAALKTLFDVGLGYLQLGQSTNTMSGGELQRLKLARELMSPTKGNTLYLFDEPSTGLHPKDVEVLIKLFQKMADLGHTLLIIEHDADIILQADWVIDLGPGGGDNGGEVVAEGTPEQIAHQATSLTGKYLRDFIVSTCLPPHTPLTPLEGRTSQRTGSGGFPL